MVNKEKSDDKKNKKEKDEDIQKVDNLKKEEVKTVKKYIIKDEKNNNIEITEDDKIFGIICYNCWHYLLELTLPNMGLLLSRLKKSGCVVCSSKLELNTTDKYKIKIGLEQFKLNMIEYSEANKKIIFQYLL